MSEEPHTKAGDVVDAAFEWCERLGLACMVMHQDGRVLRLTEGWPAIEGSVSSRDAPGLSSHRREIARDAVSSGRLDGTLSSERLSRCTPAWAGALSRQMRADRPGKFVFAMADHSRISGKLARDGRAVLVHLGATCRKDEMVVAQRLRRMVTEMVPEMAAEQDSASLVRKFSNRLSRSLAETAAVFRIRRLMTSRDEPRGQLELLCNIVQRVLPFGWVSVEFSDSPCVLNPLRGRMLIGGRPRYDAMLVQEIEQAAIDPPTKLTA